MRAVGRSVELCVQRGYARVLFGFGLGPAGAVRAGKKEHASARPTPCSGLFPEAALLLDCVCCASLRSLYPIGDERGPVDKRPRFSLGPPRRAAVGFKADAVF